MIQETRKGERKEEIKDDRQTGVFIYEQKTALRESLICLRSAY